MDIRRSSPRTPAPADGRVGVRGPWGRVRRTRWQPPAKVVPASALRLEDLPPVGCSFEDVWTFVERVTVPGVGRPSFPRVDKIRRLWAADGVLPDLEHAIMALQFESRRWRRLARDPSQAPQRWLGSDVRFIRAMVDEVRRWVALTEDLKTRPQYAPAIHRAKPSVMSLDAYREPPAISVAEVKRQLGRTPLPGDEYDQMVPVYVTGSGNAVQLSAITLHPVRWVAGMTDPVTIPARVGGTPLWTDPLYVAEVAMTALANGQKHTPADPLKTLMDVEATWQDGFSCRVPVPMVRQSDGEFGTVGIMESFLRYGLYFAGRDDWTKWEPLGFPDWGRILQLVPPASRNASLLIVEGRYQLVGGIAWQELVADDPPTD